MSKLLIGPRTEQAIASASKFKYYLIGPYRVLAYGHRNAEGLESLTADQAETFTDQELAWLDNAIKAEAKSKGESEWDSIAERGNQFLESFRRELEVERRRLEDGDKHSAGAESTAQTGG